jgi:hypothetical protein
MSLELILSTNYAEVRKNKFGLTVTLWADFGVAMANFSMFSYDLFDAPLVDPVMYSKSENFVRVSRKGVLGDSNGTFGPMGPVGPQDGVCVRCCATNFQKVRRATDRQKASPARDSGSDGKRLAAGRNPKRNAQQHHLSSSVPVSTCHDDDDNDNDNDRWFTSMLEGLVP